MKLDSTDGLFYAIVFLVPGFILQWVLTSFVPQRKEDGQTMLLRFLTLSCVNVGPWIWPLYVVSRPGYYELHPVLTGIVLMLCGFVSPLGLGLLAVHCRQNNIVRLGLQRLGFAPLHGVPFSWDYKLGDPEASWVLVTLKDGTRIGGFYGSKSFASSEPEERDLYIEQMWRIDENGTWHVVERTGGVLICAGEIRYIEFMEYKPQGENDGQPATTQPG